MVSQWAAQCRTCGHTTDDAEEPGPDEVVAVEGRNPSWLSEGPARTARSPGRTPPAAAPAPAVDPAPAPTPDLDPPAGTPVGPWWHGRRRRLVAVVAVAALIGAGAGIVAARSGPGPIPGGEVASATPAGSVVLTAPDGSVTATLASIPGTGLLFAADGRYLATGTGQEYVLRDRTLTATDRDIPLVGPPGSWRAVDFTDHDRGLVATEQSLDSGFAGVEAVTFSGHRTVDLGAAESVAGDPETLGVFGVYADPPSGSAGPGAEVLTGTAIERRDAAAAPVVLARASQVTADLGESPGTPAIFSVVPDPGGDRIAVVVVPVGPRAGPPGIVVLSRAGRLLGAEHTVDQAGGRPAWSPDGRSLVYDASTATVTAVTVWRIGHRPAVRSSSSIPVTLGGFGNCIWAISGQGFLCAGTNTSAARTDWLIGRAGGRSLVAVLGPSLPYAWLPASGSTTR